MFSYPPAGLCSGLPPGLLPWLTGLVFAGNWFCNHWSMCLVPAEGSSFERKSESERDAEEREYTYMKNVLLGGIVGR